MTGVDQRSPAAAGRLAESFQELFADPLVAGEEARIPPAT